MKRSRGMAWLVIGLIVWVGALIAGIVIVGIRGAGPSGFEIVWDEEHVLGEGPRVAIIEVTGEIFAGRGGPGPFGTVGAFGADDYTSMLRQAREDEGIEAVIIRLDTPGGAVVASDAIYREVRALRAQKPVVALMEDTAASGGYYVAAAAESIIANPSTVTGSIGVIAFFPNVEGTAEKLGVEPIIIKAGKLKDIGSPFRDMTPAERELLQRLIDEAHTSFIQAVADGRGMSVDRVRSLADGRVFSGTQALRNGLVDELGGLDRAVASVRDILKADDVEVVRFVAPPFGFGDLFAGITDIPRALRGAMRDAPSDVLGVPRRPGLHYLWLG